MTDIVSVIVTILNGEKWIDGCFKSIVANAGYATEFHIEVCAFDDASTDRTVEILNRWKSEFQKSNIRLLITRNKSGAPKGVGYGRNAAIRSSSGSYLCFQDIDDEMLPNRIYEQYQLSKTNHNALIGSKFVRDPKNSTIRFQKWANNLEQHKLQIQIYSAHGPTIIMPTWFCHRSNYDRVESGFNENGAGTPEDLIFFYNHLNMNGRILRVDKILLIYRYHENATTFSIADKTIWNIRLKRLMENELQTKIWRENGFTIWNAGRQGRRFFRDLPDELKRNVKAFCDVDKNKINRNYDYFDEVRRKVSFSIPIIHYSNAKPPIVVCMKLDLTDGEFEKNLESMNLIEGKDYVMFS